MIQIFHQEEKKEFIRDTSILLFATTGSNLANYFFHVYIARHLGPADYGILACLVAILMILYIPARAIQLVTAEYSSIFFEEDQLWSIKKLLYRSLRKLLLFGMIVLLAVMVGGSYISEFLKIPSKIPIYITTGIFIISIYVPVARGVLQGLQRFFMLGLVIFSDGAGRLIFALGLVALGLGVNGALGAMLASGLLVIIIASFSIYPVFRNLPKNSETLIKDPSSKSSYQFLGLVLTSLTFFALLTNIDLIYVKHHFSPELAGLYGSAAIVGRAFLFLPMALVWALFPRLVKLRLEQKASKKLLLNSLFWTLSICLIGLLLCVFGTKLVILNLFGQAYLAAAPLIKLFALSMTPFALVNILVNYFQARRDKIMPIILGTLAVLHIILLSIFHSRPESIIYVLLFSGLASLSALLILTFYFQKEVSTAGNI